MTSATAPLVTTGDMELIGRWSSGDQRAAALLVDRHAAVVGRFLRAQGAAEEIEELVQDTFVRAFESISQFRGESSFRTWLLAIARRLLLDRRRESQRGKVVVSLTEEDAATRFDQLDRMVARETGGRLRAALQLLTPLQREVFTLRVVEGLSYRDIATIAGTTEGAARVHYHNAVKAVKEHLDA